MTTPPPTIPRQPTTGQRTRVALLGAGFIAEVHLQTLAGLPDVVVVGICDPRVEAAQRLARKHRVTHACASLDELRRVTDVDAVHVLVPPTLHVALALQCLQQGLHVLVEKPLALTADDCERLQAAATAQHRVLAVNHNQTFHPAVVRLRSALLLGKLGKLEHVEVMHHVPLRQLATGDVSHFMFQTEANILLEQGVHLFSLVESLLGPCTAVQALKGNRRALANGVSFVEQWYLSLRCERGTAGVRMAFGKPWLETTVQCIGSDGAALLDLARGSCWLRSKTRWLEFLDQSLNLLRGGLHLTGRALGTVVGYGRALFGLGRPDDPFLASMRGALASFHQAVRGGELAPSLTPRAAREVLSLCERAAAAAGVATLPPLAPASLPAAGAPRAGEVVVLGGTGFLGKRCVALLRGLGKPVTLVVRKPHLLPAELRDGSVRVLVGDAANGTVLREACTGADAVLHLATVAGDDAQAVEQTMASAVRAAADAALAAGVRRLVYASSTAALWLGAAGVVRGDCGTDPRPQQRAAYSRGKIAAERELAHARARGLAVTIVRPAIVVGSGGSQEHSGVGMWVRDNQCIGWGSGDVPLPFVLADDCAQALTQALWAPAASNRDYNLAGDVRVTAREYLRELAARSGRTYHFHPMNLHWMWCQEVGKYAVKLLARKSREWPSLRDLQSRAFLTELDCSDSKRDLGFAPVGERQRFFALALQGCSAP